jgi:hypothetical protein
LDAEAFAAREGVRAGTLRWWRWRLSSGTAAGRPSEVPSFLEVVLPRVDAGTSAAEPPALLELHVGRHRVTIPRGFDEETLRRLLVLLEGC